MHVIVSWWRLIRGGNLFIAAAATLLGVVLTGQSWSSERGWIAALTTALVVAAANIFNDWVDRPIDRVNNPEKPLVKGEISSRLALVAASFAAALAIIVGFSLGLAIGVFVVCVMALLFIYDRYLSRSFLAGNFVVAICGGLPLIFGAVTVTSNLSALTAPSLAAALAYLMHFARELIKDVQDLPGDRSVGANTVPIRLGTAATIRFAGLLMFLTIVLLIPPVWWGWFGPIYNWGIALVIVPTLLAATLLFTIRPTCINVRQWSLGLKIVMVIGMLVIWGGTL